MGCETDGSTNCGISRCCKGHYDKCYTKNQYWAACKSSCRPGETDGFDNDPWQCHQLKPHRNPLVKCARSCEGKTDVKSCVGKCLFQVAPGEGSCAKDGSEDCSKSKC